MKRIKQFFNDRFNREVKKSVEKEIETPEKIIARITKNEEDFNDDEKPLTLRKWDSSDEYTLIDENGNSYGHVLKKEEIVKALENNNNDIKKAFRDLIKLGEEKAKEYQIQEEIEKFKEIEQRKSIREEAEKRFYGKVKENKRAPISENDKEIIFNKFGNECIICRRTEGLHIHHKDHNPSNNKLDNLLLLCGVCHKKIHMKVR